jgi:hypothetical protein
MEERLVTICTLTTQAEADLVESLLRAAGIPIVHDHEFGTAVGFADTVGIHISVRADDEERARELLQGQDATDDSDE